MITKTVVSRKPDGGISLTYYDDRDNLDSIIQRHVTALGNTVEKIVDGVLQTPVDRKDRDVWDFKNDKIELNQQKLAEKQSKEAQRQAVLTKLGITEEEFGRIKR